LKIFIDTNIFLDVILNRKDVADITLLNIDYIASKQTKNLRDFLEIINQSFTVVGVNNKMFDMALKIDNNDLEDAVQYVYAYTEQCSVIVSNDKKFYRGEIEVLGSA